jgi:hypothetical protein
MKAKMNWLAMAAWGATTFLPAAAVGEESRPGAPPNALIAQTLKFKVSLGDKEIGTQSFRLDRQGDRLTVAIEADLDVRYVAVSFYEYKHRNTEVWQGNCLESMRASTDDNGAKFVVDGARVEGGFKVSATSNQAVLPACVMSFAYWNTGFLSQQRLLNSQTGVFEEVQIRKLGKERIMVRKQPVEAIHYKLQGNKIDIDLWYSEDDRWLRLESEVNDNRLIYDLI